MSDMVERVAFAIRESMDSLVPMEGDYAVMARAAIEALREPTKTMMDAWEWSDQRDVKNAWQGMLDDALR